MARFIFNPFSATFDAVNDPSDEPLTFAAECGVSGQLHQFVYIVGTSDSGIPRVAVADPTDSLKMPAIGVIVAKPSNTACTVAWFGAVTLSGLSSNGVYYLDTTGFATETVPDTRPVYIQSLGQSLSPGQLLLNPSRDLFNLAV